MATIRRPGAASATVLIGLTASLVAANLIAPTWARQVGLDVWNYAAADADRRAAREERTEMEAKGEREGRRRARANQLASGLITGDGTLAAVAAEIMELFREDPGTLSALEANYPSVSDPRLLFARHTIHRATRLLDHDPVRREAVRMRLETDYRELEANWGSASVQ